MDYMNLYLFKAGAMSMHLIYGGFVRGTGSRLYCIPMLGTSRDLFQWPMPTDLVN